MTKNTENHLKHLELLNPDLLFHVGETKYWTSLTGMVDGSTRYLQVSIPNESWKKIREHFICLDEPIPKIKKSNNMFGYFKIRSGELKRLWMNYGNNAFNQSPFTEIVFDGEQAKFISQVGQTPLENIHNVQGTIPFKSKIKLQNIRKIIDSLTDGVEILISGYTDQPVSFQYVPFKDMHVSQTIAPIIINI